LTGWGKYQTAEEMELGRRYEYRNEFLSVLFEWLGVKPETTSVDVGCGSGYFTRIVANGLRGKGRVIGIDPDEFLIVKARKIAEKKKISELIEFKVGNTYNISLPDNFCDLVSCHIVLCNIPRQLDAVMEMTRVAKIGGTVAAIEPAGGGGNYYPDTRLNELHAKFKKAFGTTIDREWRQRLDMSRFIADIHLRLPELFLKAGLRNIALNGYLSTFLLCDARNNLEEMRRYLEARLYIWQKLEKRNRKCALVGGMNTEEFEELFQRYVAYLSALIKDPKKIRETAEVEVVSRVVVTGKKADYKT